VLSIGDYDPAQVRPLKPGPELKKLDGFVGTWTLEGSMKPGMMGPGGPVTEEEKCGWMEGGFYLVCHLEYKGSIGDKVGLSVRGYSADDKVYTYRAFNSAGEFEDSRGTFDGETWKWTTETKMGGVTVKSRFTMKMNSAISYNFAYETSGDGAKWTTVIDGTGTKK
jgi:hypothetical protein